MFHIFSSDTSWRNWIYINFNSITSSKLAKRSESHKMCFEDEQVSTCIFRTNHYEINSPIIDYNNFQKVWHRHQIRVNAVNSVFQSIKLNHGLRWKITKAAVAELFRLSITYMERLLISLIPLKITSPKQNMLYRVSF